MFFISQFPALAKTILQLPASHSLIFRLMGQFEGISSFCRDECLHETMSSQVTYLPCQPGINLAGLGGNLRLVLVICKPNGEEGVRTQLPALSAASSLPPHWQNKWCRDQKSSPRLNKYFISHNGNCQIDLIVQYVISEISKPGLASPRTLPPTLPPSPIPGCRGCE